MGCCSQPEAQRAHRYEPWMYSMCMWLVSPAGSVQPLWFSPVALYFQFIVKYFHFIYQTLFLRVSNKTTQHVNTVNGPWNCDRMNVVTLFTVGCKHKVRWPGCGRCSSNRRVWTRVVAAPRHLLPWWPATARYSGESAAERRQAFSGISSSSSFSSSSPNPAPATVTTATGELTENSSLGNVNKNNMTCVYRCRSGDLQATRHRVSHQAGSHPSPVIGLRCVRQTGRLSWTPPSLVPLAPYWPALRTTDTQEEIKFTTGIETYDQRRQTFRRQLTRRTTYSLS